MIASSRRAARIAAQKAHGKKRTVDVIPNKKEIDKKGGPPVGEQFITPNSIFICIASGPSLNQSQIDIIGQAKKELSQKIKVLAVNDNWQWKYQDNFISDHLYAADTDWWKIHLEKINESGFSGDKWIPIRGEFAKNHGLNRVHCVVAKGLGTGNALHCHHNSGAQAIGLAYFLGAKKIILVGYDMKPANDGKVHWFGNHPKGLRNTPQKYKHWIESHHQINVDLKSLNIDCVNCTLDTAIPHYRKGNLQDELKSNLPIHGNS